MTTATRSRIAAYGWVSSEEGPTLGAPVIACPTCTGNAHMSGELSTHEENTDRTGLDVNGLDANGLPVMLDPSREEVAPLDRMTCAMMNVVTCPRCGAVL